MPHVQVVPDAERAWYAGHGRMIDRSIGIDHVALAGPKIAPAQSETLPSAKWLQCRPMKGWTRALATH